MTVVTPTDRLKSVRKRCVIDLFGGVYGLSIGFRNFCSYRSFVIGLSQISFFFSLSGFYVKHVRGIHIDKLYFILLL